MSGDIGTVQRLVPGLQSRLIEKVAPEETAEQGKFTEVFGNMINSVNELQQDAASLQEQMAAGEAVDLHQVMIAVEKAGVSMDLLLEIRNRLVEGYQSLIKMPM